MQSILLAPAVISALSEKSDGPMKLGNPHSPALVNRERYFEKLNIPSNRTVTADLAHGAVVKEVTAVDAGGRIFGADGLVTREKNLYLTVTVADCLPIFLYAPGVEAVGVLHAGRKGLGNNIPQSAVATMVSGLNAAPATLRVGIGPGIGPCHYEVVPEYAALFSKYPESVIRRDGLFFLDLKQIARSQFLSAGVQVENITIDPSCTYCETNRFFSNRRDKPVEVEAMLAVIGLR